MSYYKDAIELSEAFARLSGRIPSLPSQNLPLHVCLGLRSGDRIYVRHPEPRFDCSAMDGYAVHAEDLAGRRLEVVGEARIGGADVPTLAPGQAIYIDTGAQLPTGACAVVPIEDATRVGRHVVVAATEGGRHVKRVGEKRHTGELLLESGFRLGLAEISLIASQGVSEIPVVPRPTVSFVRTGDEIAAQPGPGQVSDAHSSTVRAWAASRYLELLEIRTSGDSLNQIRAELLNARADLIITSGGASVGERDFTRRAVADVAEIVVPGVKVRPGSPAFVAVSDSKVFLGLPGNPEAAVHQLQLLGDFLVELLSAGVRSQCDEA